MAVYDTVHGFVDEASGREGARGLGPVIGMKSGTLQNKANPNEEYTHLTLPEARSVMLATGDFRILQALAAELGQACVPLPTIQFPADCDLMVAWADWQAEIAQTVVVMRDSLADGKVTRSEVDRLRKELIEDFEKGLALLDVFRGMSEPDVAAPVVALVRR
ncbi:MAG: hypothetical protein Q8M07_01065 [Prosthecobacter sp.]|nr:hypothetical protein [Prosthecobacter sp.]